MAASSVYTKTGTKSDMERKFVKGLEKYVDAQKKLNPGFTYTPATTFAQLRNNWQKFCTDETPIISETKNIPEEKKPAKSVPLNSEKEIIDSTLKQTESVSQPTVNDIDHDRELYKKDMENETVIEAKDIQETKKVVDPLLRGNAIVREYVQSDEGMKRPEEKAAESAASSSTSTPPPTSFDDAFKIPDNKTGAAPGAGQAFGTKPGSGGPPKPKPVEHQPINPNFEDMKKSKQNKQTRRFVKGIVQATAFWMEKGLIWWTTKDIDEAKCIAYGIDGSINLEMLLILNDGQEVMVRQFFMAVCAKAEVHYKWTPDEIEDLEEALYEVMIERGLAPTPMQVLLSVGVSILGKHGFNAFIEKSQVNAVLTMARIEKPEEVAAPPVQRAEPVHAPPAPAPAPEPEATYKPKQRKRAAPKGPEVVHAGDSNLDPEKVMRGEQVVAEEPARRASRKTKVNEIETT